jgi:hypothetical protein
MDSSKESKTSSSTIDSQGLCGNLQGVHASKAPRCRSIPRCLPPLSSCGRSRRANGGHHSPIQVSRALGWEAQLQSRHLDSENMRSYRPPSVSGANDRILGTIIINSTANSQTKSSSDRGAQGCIPTTMP